MVHPLPSFSVNLTASRNQKINQLEMEVDAAVQPREIPQDILDKIMECLKDDEKRLGQVLYFLADEKPSTTSGYIQIMKTVTNESKAFETIVQKLAAKTDRIVVVAEPVEHNGGHSGRAVQIVGSTLVAIYLSWEAYVNIRDWYQGKISAAECLKNLMASTKGLVRKTQNINNKLADLLARSAGSQDGEDEEETRKFLDRMRETFFNTRKDVALENAYRFMGIENGAPDEEINASYERLALKYHPDKGGDCTLFQELQVHMAIIASSKDLLVYYLI